MTLNEIISTLKKNCVNSKGQVLNALKNASVDDLRELRNSITEEIILKEKKENGLE